MSVEACLGHAGLGLSRDFEVEFDMADWNAMPADRKLAVNTTSLKGFGNGDSKL